MKKKIVAVHKAVSIESIEKDYLNDQFIKDQLTYRLEGYIYEQTEEEKEVSFICRKPTFLDWLFRRERRITFNVNFCKVKSGSDTFNTYYIKEKP